MIANPKYLWITYLRVESFKKPGAYQQFTLLTKLNLIEWCFHDTSFPMFQGQNILGVWSNVTEEISQYSTKLLWFKVGCIVKVLESNFVSFYFNLIEWFSSENSNTWSDIQTSFKPWVAAIIVSSAHLSDDTLLCQKEKTARSILKPSRQHRSNQ